ncbi:MFS transporter [Thiotrichales bacterium 19S9-12]|nr:MFS transporter [Thiotrichales bacterium 19S9-11]MCF6810913.1 MFS transporter [Thiotrichales bacterium 19S9-12]
MQKNSQLKVAVLAGTGGMLEFYDFILYILFSHQIEKIFFQDIESDYLRNLIVIAVFSVAYIVRPLGGFIMGWFGDNIGRKSSFSFTILLMGICVFLMGVMPTYDQVGVVAPILFILLRIVQGFALGGELPGAIVFVYESVEKRGFALGVMFAMVFMGFLLGDIMSVILTSIFGEYAWRAAFISGSIIAFVGYYIRAQLHETELFNSLEEKVKFPLLTLLTKQAIMQIGAILCVIIVAFNGVMVSLYIPKYLESYLDYPYQLTQFTTISIALVNILIIFISSLLTDYIDYKKLYQLVALSLAVISFPCFYFITSKNPVLFFIGMFLIAVIPSIATGIFMRILCDAFSTSVRYSGVAIGYNLAFALVGGMAPLASEVMIHKINLIAGPAIVGVICGILSFIAIFMIRKTNV